MSLYFLFAILLAFHLPAIHAVQCCKAPNLCWDVGDRFEPAAPQPAPRTNHCPLPTSRDPNLYYMPNSWKQERPWLNMGPWSVNAPYVSGWALDARSAFGCMAGSWCPYACKSPYFETQYDNAVGQPWQFETSCGGKNWLIGGGRRPMECPGAQSNPAKPMCAGGSQGLYCNLNKEVEVRAPSSKPPTNYQKLCMLGEDAVEVVNDTPWPITACRTVFPGSEIPQIPTEIPPGGKAKLATPRPRLPTGQPAFWTAGGSVPVGLQYYFMRPVVNGQECLKPQCQWIKTRPGTTQDSIGGIDYTPYILEYSPSANSNSFDINVRINCDASVAPNAGYAGALGAPMYGMQIYDTSGQLQCNAYWEGPIGKPDDLCNTICTGWGCANKPCSGSTCAMTPFNCNTPGARCSPIPVEPVIKRGDGTHFATGTGLRAACKGSSWNVDAPASRKIKVRLYPYCGAGKSCPGASQPAPIEVRSGPAVKINFQPSGSDTPAGYLADTGAVFGPREEGHSYGWSAGASDDARERRSPASASALYDTLIHTRGRVWQLALPNGVYDVKLVAGDPTYYGGCHRVSIGGVPALAGCTSSSLRWLSYHGIHHVTDGRLRVSDTPGYPSVNKLCFIEVRPASGTVASVTVATSGRKRDLATPHLNLDELVDTIAAVTDQPTDRFHVLGQSPASRGGTTVRLLIRDDPDAYYVPSNVVAARLTNISASAWESYGLGPVNAQYHNITMRELLSASAKPDKSSRLQFSDRTFIVSVSVLSAAVAVLLGIVLVLGLLLVRLRRASPQRTDTEMNVNSSADLLAPTGSQANLGSQVNLVK